MSKTVFLGIVFGLILGIAPIGDAQDLIIGYVLVEYYDDIGSGSTVDDLIDSSIFPSEATEMVWLESFETPTNRAEDYGTRVGGYLIPPETGDYTFWIASDDQSQLWLSPDDSDNNAQLIASVSGWASPRVWDKYSDQQSEPVSLIAGQKYYIEALHKEGGGGDNLAVGWAGPGIADGNTVTVIDGQYLSPYITGDDDPLIVQYYKARTPSPADEGLADSTSPTLSWASIIYADHYLVYISTDQDAVANGTVDAINTSTNSYTAAGLSTSTIYYWRVDGIEADGTIYQGNVWSFTVAPKSATQPSPADGVLFVDPNTDLSWTAGLGAIEHHLYFGSNADDVVAGTNGADKGVLTKTTFDPNTLERGVTYYWRVDESDGEQTYTGALWQFQVEYDVPLNEDPNLVGWWKMEEGITGRVVDWSGHGNDGTIEGDPLWVTAEDGMGLDFDGDDIVSTGKYASELGIGGNAPRTITTWMYLRSFNGAGAYEIGGGNAGQFSLVARSGYETSWRLQHWYADTDFDMEALNEWVHTTQTYDGSEERVYKNGELVVTFEVELNTSDEGPFTIGKYRYNYFDGILDDIRIYDKSVTEEDIAQIMRGNLLRAWAPQPGRNADVDILQAASLSFNAGDGAIQHDIYFGTTSLAVEEALPDAGLSPEYQGRYTETVLDITGKVEMGMTYYWRVDEIDSEGLLTKGRLWSFTTVDYIVVDDFESYNDIPQGEEGSNLVYLTWVDGYDNPAENGSTMGYIAGASLDTVTVHGGLYSAPLIYDNAKASLSEVTANASDLLCGSDWTVGSPDKLVVWVYGRAANPSTEQMYAEVDGAKSIFSGDIASEEWQEFPIDLASLGINQSNVGTVTIGLEKIGATGGSGWVFIDDIWLYSPAAAQ